MKRNGLRTVQTAALLAVFALVGGCQNGAHKAKSSQRWNSARAGVMHNLAKQHYEGGNLVEARKTVNQAKAMDPKSVRIYVLSAKVGIEEGKLEQAEGDLLTASALDPKNAEADYLRGVIHQRWQKLDSALELYTSASDKQPDELAYVLARSETLVLLDRTQGAVDLLRQKLDFFENSGAIRDALGQLLLEQGKYAEAATMLRQASLLAPDELTTREHLAMALFYNKDFREAGQQFERLVADKKYGGSRVDLITALGECHLQNGRPRDARDRFEEAAQLDGSNVSIHLSLAKVGLQLNDLKRADLSVRKALALEPKNSEAHLMLGYLRLREEKLDEALASFKRASLLDPKDVVSLCMAGFVLEKQGRGAEAINCYARALKLRPDDELATTLMAQVQANE